MKTYYHKVLKVNENRPQELERRLNTLAKSGYAMLSVSTRGTLIIMAKERPS